MSGFVCVARRCAKKSASGFSEALFLGMGWEVILGVSFLVPCSDDKILYGFVLTMVEK